MRLHPSPQFRGFEGRSAAGFFGWNPWNGEHHLQRLLNRYISGRFHKIIQNPYQNPYEFHYILPGTIQKSILFSKNYSRFLKIHPKSTLFPCQKWCRVVSTWLAHRSPGESRLQHCLSLQGVRHLATAATDTKCGVTGHHWGRYHRVMTNIAMENPHHKWRF